MGSPADLSLIRMQSDSTLPAAQRRNYKGVGDALTRIVKDEGAIGLFRGAGPTVTRAMALNMGMLASNDQVGCLCLRYCCTHQESEVLCTILSDCDGHCRRLQCSILSQRIWYARACHCPARMHSRVRYDMHLMQLQWDARQSCRCRLTVPCIHSHCDVLVVLPIGLAQHSFLC